MIRSRLFIILFFIAVSTQSAFSQASLVPVYHQVYDWLHYQRVRGNAPLYNYETLPLTRGQITQLLADIDPNELNKGDRHVRHSYLREFSVDSLKKYKELSLVQGDKNIYEKLKIGLFSDEEPHIYVWGDDNINAALDLADGVYGTWVSDGESKYKSPGYYPLMFRSYGTIYNLIGFHYEQYSIGKGDPQTFDYLPFYSRNAKFLRPGLNSDTKQHLENYIGLNYKLLHFYIGRGTLKSGVGSRNNLVFSRESIPFDFIKLSLNSRYINFTTTYGALSWEPAITNAPLEGYEGEYTRTSPQRWVVHQRIQFQPFSWLKFGFYETNVFSNRSMDLAFINPINRLSIMEWEQYDKGNGFAGFEGILRPIKGLELYGELQVDDLARNSDLFRWTKKNGDYTTTKLARHLGLKYASYFGTSLTVEYQRLDPGFYSHKYILNTYSEKGFSLGSQLGPNADELSIGIDQWLRNRTRIHLRYDYVRHGLNYFDQNGEFVDAGGDILDSYKLDDDLRPVRPGIFLDGDLHRYNRFTVESTYQPWRGITIEMQYSIRLMLEGEQLFDLSVFTIGFKIGD
ncbi:MAG: hypothetical protein JJ895_11985 [Balneolaceae bacterium]|nr:hypothetical protein [Balneolaceae bacterium]